MRRFLLSLFAPKICKINDVIVTRSGKAYWVQPGKLIAMRVVKLNRIEETE